MNFNGIFTCFRSFPGSTFLTEPRLELHSSGNQKFPDFQRGVRVVFLILFIGFRHIP